MPRVGDLPDTGENARTLIHVQVLKRKVVQNLPGTFVEGVTVSSVPDTPPAPKAAHVCSTFLAVYSPFGTDMRVSLALSFRPEDVQLRALPNLKSNLDKSFLSFHSGL